MARLILKSPYIKSTGGAVGYLRYIATRERVEILPDDRPPTRKQEQLIAKLVKDFPDTKTLYEYESYQAKPTKAAASAFLTLALESNWDALQQSEQYLKYIATRPRAERLGSHGLFGDSDGVSLEKAMEELEQYTGNEMLRLYEQKSASRDELVRQARRAMLELVQAMRDGLCDHPEAERLMQELAMQLGTVKGKKSYGYLPKRLKGLVDEIVDQMERLPIVRQCYDQWLLLQGKVDGYYHDKPRERLPLSKEKEFRQIKNAVIREAERLRLGQVTFEDQDMGQRDEPEQFRNAPYAYWTLQEVIRNEELTMEERSGAVSELEKLAKGGDRYSQYLLGKLWRDGPLLIPDGVNARHWFEQAARQGHLAAQYALAKLYLSDDLEVRDTARGMDWLRTAAEGGNRWAMYRLGKELLRGEITKQDAAGAVEWFTRSAEQDNPYAQYLLGKLYLMGKEVPRDEECAVQWLTRSAEQGNEYARYLLDHREEQRPPDVMLAVTRLLYHMSRVFQDNSLPESRPGGIQIDRKRLRKLREKKIAQGHKPDDHEEQWPQMTM